MSKPPPPQPPAQEPPSVVAARQEVLALNKRIGVYMGGIMLFIFGILGAAFAEQPAVLFSVLSLYVAWALGGIAYIRPKRHKEHQHVIREWESRALRDEFSRFDQSVDTSSDPRLAAAAQMAERIRALDTSPEATDVMVTRLESRLGRLITDQIAAQGAVQALTAAGAGSVGTGRLAEAAQHLDEEISRILSGMSDLYAALLEAKAGSPVDSLGSVMAWLEAEAEIARAAHEDEALRPARGAREQRATAGTEPS